MNTANVCFEGAGRKCFFGVLKFDQNPDYLSSSEEIFADFLEQVQDPKPPGFEKIQDPKSFRV